MRIAYLSTDRGIAYGGTKGASAHMEEMARALARQGAEVLLLVARLPPGAPPPPPGITVERLPGPREASVADWLEAEPVRSAWIEKRLRSFRAVALYERLALHSAAGGGAARALGIPHILELNAALLDEAARYRRLEHGQEADRLEQLTLARADLVLAVSRPLASYATARGARRIEVSPNAVAVERFTARRVWEPASPTAVFAGTLRPWHGIEAIAQAWRLLGRTAPPSLVRHPVPLLVIGDGAGRELLERVGAEITGAVPRAAVPSLMARAEIGLLPFAKDAPSYFSPLKLFEYLAAGLAVIAGDLPGVRDVVCTEDREVAVLIPPGDQFALAEAVAELARDSSWREQLGRAGRSLVERTHTWDRRGRRVLDAMAELAALEVTAR
jgi:glycosyltransferase involved in cell wall biosynthesis